MQMQLSDEERRLVEDHRRRKAAESWEPRSLIACSASDKINAFDSLFRLAVSMFVRIRSDDAEADFLRREAYFAVMDLLGKGWREAIEFHTGEKP